MECSQIKHDTLYTIPGGLLQLLFTMNI